MSLFRKFAPRLSALLKKRGISDSDAEELVQEAFLRLLQYRKDNEVGREEGFLVRTAVNLSIDANRRARRFDVVSEPVDDLLLVDETPDPERVAIGRSRLEHLVAGFERLDPKTRAMVKARRIEGLSMREIALRDGVSVSAVEKRIAKAMLFLSVWMRNY
ncbi:sigma-70 family RNA polymerase sigma factor [Altererythrobacter sp. FM1]|uniref:RNA polymerase sigma factor n=1 Tax=Tsuneonella flava TaxID=2055955 RepID=UPI000C80577C|nr:sigma-70 family RNA polymerase sigma factor [Tsuneonella flava]ROT93428.1 sigma-70 family RNA polymerase sigma factor [Altererythrobacter sp. FM1]